MAPLAALLVSPVIVTLIDAVIAFTLLEGAALATYHALTGRGVAKRDFMANMVSGLCLMLALRCLAHDAGPAWIAAFLLAAGIAHASDIRSRWKRNAASTSRTTGAAA